METTAVCCLVFFGFYFFCTLLVLTVSVAISHKTQSWKGRTANFKRVSLKVYLQQCPSTSNLTSVLKQTNFSYTKWCTEWLMITILA